MAHERPAGSFKVLMWARPQPPENVRYPGKTGSGRLAVKVTRLTHRVGALWFAPGNGKANAARATNPANAAWGQIGVSGDYHSLVRDKVLCFSRPASLVVERAP
jgi:hypothetical protein